MTLEHWLPPDDLFDVEIIANRINVTFTLAGPDLKPWCEISPSLTNVSGIDYYTTSFLWPPSLGSADGVVLRLPPITQGVSASLNRHNLPRVDITHPISDLSSYLVKGENYLSLSVASTLWNVARPMWEKLRTGTSTPLPQKPEELEEHRFGGVQRYGIIGEVQIVPYVVLAL